MKDTYNAYIEQFDLTTMSWVYREDITDWQEWVHKQEEYCKNKATTFDWVDFLSPNNVGALHGLHPFYLWRRRCASYIRFFNERHEKVIIEYNIEDAMMSNKKIQDFMYTEVVSSKKWCYMRKPLSFWDTEVRGCKGGGFSEINWPQ